MRNPIAYRDVKVNSMDQAISPKTAVVMMDGRSSVWPLEDRTFRKRWTGSVTSLASLRDRWRG